MSNNIFFSKKILLSLIILFVATWTAFVYAHSELNPKPSQKTFQITKGINLNEWLEKSSLDSIRLDTLVTHEKILLLKQLGFDHVRIPISEAILLDENLNYRENVKNVLIDRTNFCIKNCLKVIIDLHITLNHLFGKENKAILKFKNF